MNQTKYIYFNFFILMQFLVLGFFISSCKQDTGQNEVKIAEFNKILKTKLSPSQIDSVYQEINSCTVDSSRVDLLLIVYKKSIRSRPIRKDILDSALSISKRINYNLGTAQAYDKKGLNFRYGLEYEESVKYHKLALGYFRQTTDTFRTIKCLNSLGVSLRRLNYEREAMIYYLEALELSRLINNDKSIAVALNGIGNVFVNIEQYTKALPYFLEALAIEEENNNKRGINYDLSNIGETYMYQHKYDSALHYYYLALDIAKELNHKDNASIIYNCIGQLYQLKSNYIKSSEYYNLAIPKLEEYGGKRYLSNSLINLGINNSNLSNPSGSIQYIEDGLKIAKEINSPENIILGYQALSDYYKKQNKFDLALINYKKTIALRDSVKGEETKQNIAALESIYENELKEKEIKKYQLEASLQQQENTTQWLLIVFLIFTVLGIFYYYQIKRKNNKLVIEQMRNDIQEYIIQIEEFEKQPDGERGNEKELFYKNVEQYGLSERELDVLLLISQGLKNDEIAEKLFVSVSTIKTHTRNIFIKLDVRNRIEATRKAQRM